MAQAENEVVHQTAMVNGARMHWAEAGQGPVVLMVHGFPESWYSWRNQLPALAAAGYRAVAIDVRGYGRSTKPNSVADYRMVKNVGDIVGLAEVFGDDITLVGHDWGAPIVWNSALLRPDLFRGVAGLSVPYSRPGGGIKPTAGMRANAGADHEFYIEYFQEVGRAEAEIEADVRAWLLGFYWCASGDIVNGPNIALVPRGSLIRDLFQYPETMPARTGEADPELYTRGFGVPGFFSPPFP